MKNLVICISLLCTAGIMHAQEAPDSTVKKGPILAFERFEISDTVYLKGSNTAELKSKEFKYAEYKFVNAGDEPLLITHVTQPAPCFIAEWPRQEVKPGESGVIRVACPGRQESADLVMGFTVTSNDAAGVKLLTLKRHYGSQ